MSRWPGRLITKTPVTPSGPAPTSSAPGVWTLPEVAYWNKQGRWPSASADPYWSYVSFLLGTTATNAAQNNTFLDSSTNNFTITRNGNTTQGSLTPYAPLWSNYFDGSSGYLTVAYNTAFNVPGDFTIEAWVYQTGRSSAQSVVNRSGVSNAQFSSFELIIQSNGTVTFQQGSGSGTSGSQASPTSSTAIPLNTWTHLAGVKNGSTVTLYINGVQAATSGAGTNDANTTSGISIGTRNTTDQIFSGYISNVRLAKGTALYTAAFTPSFTPLTAISGTSLLTCQSNRFIDNSSNAFAITRNGDTAVSAFSPFVLAPPGYDTAANGGSGYFDGSGDYLSLSAATALDLASSDFTIEGWAFPGTQTNVVDAVFGYGVYTTMLYRNGTTWTWEVGNGSSANYFTITATCTPNAWQHFALTRSGNTFTFWINGVSAGTNTTTNAVGTSGKNLAIGYNNSSTQYFTGYISNFRIVKGTAVYTAAFTPPTTPVTAITNTSLLLNFANGGIYDAAMQNNMETVGNAQVSTGQAKYGTTSVAFNGSTDWLSTPNKPAHNFGTGDFTIEGWVYPTGTNSQATIASNYNGPSDGWGLLLGSTGPLFGWGDTNLLTGSSAFSQNAWNHIAISRSGASLRMFLNGTQVASASNSTNFTTTGTLYLGRLREATAGFYWQGYIDDLRITKGYARYTANFTPPAAALPVY